MTRWHLAVALSSAVFLCASPGPAQQPFVTDDADVATYHRWHLESNNEFDVLAHEVYPGLRQDTQTIKFSYGAFHNIELGMDFPFLAIFNTKASGLSDPIGFGDADFSVKWNFHKEGQGVVHPALAASLNIEAPTGDPHNGLGSGVPDYYLNGIAQKTLTDKTALHVNAGAYFAGNTLTGLVGIRQRGTLFTSGASLVHQFTPRLDLGVELNGAMNTRFRLPRGQLQGTFGGNYAVQKNLTFDFGLIGGRFAGSPRAGLQLGVSKDF